MNPTQKPFFSKFVEGCGTHAVVDFPKTDLGSLQFQFALTLFFRLNYAGIPISYYGFRKGKSQIILEPTLPLDIQGVGRFYAEGKAVKLYRVYQMNPFYPPKVELWSKGENSDVDSLLIIDPSTFSPAFSFGGTTGTPNDLLDKVSLKKVFSRVALGERSSYIDLVNSIYAMIQSVGYALSHFFEEKGFTLIDFKIELGVNSIGQVVVLEPILLSDMRLQVKSTRERWDVEGRPEVDQEILYRRIINA